MAKGNDFEFSSDDEIDTFHREKYENTLAIVDSKSENKQVKEVFSIKDLSDSDNDEKVFASTSKLTNSWGKVRKNFYGASYVDQGKGGVVDSDEEEMLDMEEEEAVIRQKRNDSSYSKMNWQAHGYKDSTTLSLQNLRNSLNKIREKIVNENRQKLMEEKNTNNHTDESTEGVIHSKELRKTSKRAITYEMMKNKGIKKKSSNNHRHSRVKKREQYFKALIRRRSQVPDIKYEKNKYDGEKRGIRSSVIRSIKLK